MGGRTGAAASTSGGKRRNNLDANPIGRAAVGQSGQTTLSHADAAQASVNTPAAKVNKLAGGSPAARPHRLMASNTRNQGVTVSAAQLTESQAATH
jgi:hypothetical protein